MTVILLSSLVSRCESSEQILLIRLLKYVLVLSQMPLKNIIEAKSSQKSWILLEGSSLCKILIISSFLQLFISQASLIISSFKEIIPFISLPKSWTLTVYISMIYPQIFSILRLDRLVISSMKSRMASLALSLRIFWMWRLFTNCISFITFNIVRQDSVASNWVLPPLPACLNRRILFLNIKKSMKSLSSSLKRNPFSFLSWIILRISLWQSSTEWSASALLIIKQQPSLISSKVLKLRCRLRISFGSLSALASLMWLQSIIRTNLTF